MTGPSGAGESTITGLDRPREGRVEWQGQNIARLSESARDAWHACHVGLVMQDFHLFPGLGALENVLLPARFRHLRLPAALRERAAALLERVGLPGTTTRGIETFSRGETQLVLSSVFLQPSPLTLLPGAVLKRPAEAPRVECAAPMGFGDSRRGSDRRYHRRMRRGLRLRPGRGGEFRLGRGCGDRCPGAARDRRRDQAAARPRRATAEEHHGHQLQDHRPEDA